MTGLPFDILVITDRLAGNQVGRTMEESVIQLLQSSFSHRVAVLVRDKSAPPERVSETIQRLLPITQSAGTKILVHTYVDLALEFGLDGVHFASNVCLESIQLPSEFLLGVSRHGQDPLDQADIGLANYATISPIYHPTSKPDDTRIPLGLSGLQICIQRSVRPLVALGGMQFGRVAGAIAAGASAIAISGAIMQAEQPATILQQLCEEIDSARTRLKEA